MLCTRRAVRRLAWLATVCCLPRTTRRFRVSSARTSLPTLPSLLAARAPSLFLSLSLSLGLSLSRDLSTVRDEEEEECRTGTTAAALQSFGQLNMRILHETGRRLESRRSTSVLTPPRYRLAACCSVLLPVPLVHQNYVCLSLSFFCTAPALSFSLITCYVRIVHHVVSVSLFEFGCLLCLRLLCRFASIAR